MVLVIKAEFKCIGEGDLEAKASYNEVQCEGAYVKGSVQVP